jgi:hypothetical protein
VRDVIHTVQGADRAVRFDDLTGRADGSFASASAPGTDSARSATPASQFYRADGSGAAHYDDVYALPPARGGFAPADL